MLLNKTLHELELEGWSDRAAFYDDLFAGVSAQAIGPILDHIGNLQGKKLLDVACGTGHLVEAAGKRGAISIGIDFAETMVAAAQTNYPHQSFRVADATDLPFDDASFDAVTCSFGLSHMEFPKVAVQEAFRVLRPGGYFAFTLWYGANDGGELLAIVQAAITRHMTQAVELPEAWIQLRHANTETCANIVGHVGFMSPMFTKLPITMTCVKAQPMFDVIGKISVRTRMVLESQPHSVQEQILRYAVSDIDNHRVNGLITMGWPALLTIAQKPL